MAHYLPTKLTNLGLTLQMTSREITQVCGRKTDKRLITDREPNFRQTSDAVLRFNRLMIFRMKMNLVLVLQLWYLSTKATG